MESKPLTRAAQRRCPVCHETFVEVLHTQRFVLPVGHPLANGYDVVCCKNCGFIFADVSSSQDTYDRFYAQFSKYEDKKTSTGGGQDPFDVARLAETARICTSVFSDKRARIVDVGCANGGLLHEIQRLGFRNILGIDPSKGCVETITHHFGIPAMTGSLTNLPAEDKLWDLVILSHVLEHVHDLDQAIANVANRVQENGFIYAEVPDATRYAEKIAAPFQEFNTEHINHFSLDALTNLFARHHFVIRDKASRTIRLDDGSSYPVIHVLVQSGPARPEIYFDTVLRTSILTYISQSQKMLADLDRRLANLLDGNPEIIVWGTGQLAMKLLADTCLGRARIVSFVDGNPINQGKIIAGKKIISPEALKQFNDYPILITTLLHHRAIQEDIRKAGLRNPVYTLE